MKIFKSTRSTFKDIIIFEFDLKLFKIILKMTKHLFFVRHGHSLHNELYEIIGEKDYTHHSVVGSSLTQKGIEQTKNLRNEIGMLDNFDLILVSPLDRCLQTVEIILPIISNSPEIISLDEMIEYEISDTENYRKDKDELSKKYPFVNLGYISNKFINPKSDNLKLLQQRIDSFKSIISLISSVYRRILVVGHTSWLNMLLFNNPNCSKLEHCKIYDYNIKLQ